MVVFFSAFLAAGFAGAGVVEEDELEVVPELVLVLELDDFFEADASALESVR